MHGKRLFTFVVAVVLAGSFNAEAQVARELAEPVGKTPITNRDVIKMVKTDVAESAILISIRTGGVKFDLSSGALVELRKAGVSQKIVDEMLARGKAGISDRNGAGVINLQGATFGELPASAAHG